MPKDKREASLEKIRNSKTTRCILISFKAGSTGEFRRRLRLYFSFHRLPCLLWPGAVVFRVMVRAPNPGWSSREVASGVLFSETSFFFVHFLPPESCFYPYLGTDWVSIQNPHYHLRHLMH